MAGIEVGASGIAVLRATRASEAGGAAAAERIEHLPLDHLRLDRGALPHDLLLRVAEGSPYVRLREDGCELVPVRALYAESIAAALAAAGIETGEEPVAVSIPAWWSRGATAEVASALDGVGVSAVLVNEAEAAVREYRAGGSRGSGFGSSTPSRPVPSIATLPSTVAVLSLRAGWASVAFVRDCDAVPIALQRPALVHGEGGGWLDRAVLRHLVDGLAELGCEVDASDPSVAAAARDALRRSRELREALSTSVSESTLSELPGAERRVLLARAELEEVAAPWADAVVGLLGTALERSPLSTDTVLLTGGLAVMPLIAQRISADLGLEVLVPDDPDLVALRGAERLRRERVEAATAEQNAAAPRPARAGLWGALKAHFAHGGAAGSAVGSRRTDRVSAGRGGGPEPEAGAEADADEGLEVFSALWDSGENTGPLPLPQPSLQPSPPWRAEPRTGALR